MGARCYSAAVKQCLKETTAKSDILPNLFYCMFFFVVALAGLAAAAAIVAEHSPARARLAFGVMTYQKEGDRCTIRAPL